ncbi:MAG: Ig-like domain-containing protein, partial [Acutalibacteraceae bacterium]|nr:Ig-like domain-containing protein [Acutalibacteraceae bacterium]
MKNLKRALAIVLTALMVQSIVASSVASVSAADTSQVETSADSTYSSSGTSEVQDIALDKGKLLLYKGDTQQLNAILTPEDAQDTITWTSSNTAVVTVDNSGMVTASEKETGTAVISATTSNGKIAYCNVTVSNEPEYVYLNKTEVTIIQGETYTLTPSVTPTDAYTEYNWSIDDSTVATVDKNGTVTAKKLGTTTVAVTTTTGKSTLCTINVITVPKTIKLNKTELSLRTDETYTLTKSVSPSTATATYKWSSSDTSVATVDQNGKITAKALGTTLIRVKANNGVTSDCLLTVCEYPTSVSLTKSELDLVVGSYEQLTPQLQPENAYATYKWTSSNTNIALVDSNGKVTARGVGTATITAVTDNGKTTTCKVNVTAVPTSIKFNEISSNEALPMRKDETFQLTTTVKPTNATTSYKWESNNPDVVSVDENGLLTAKELGSATITVTTDNNLQASCEVVVYKTPTSISLNASEITLNSTETFQIIPNVQPSDSYCELTSIISDKSIFTIDTKGLITARNPGSATLTVTTDTGLSAECIINVTSIPTDLEITNKQPIKLKVGGTVRLNKKVTPSNAITTYEWTSSDEDIATVDANGLVTAKAIGTTTITVKTENGISTSCVVEVCPDPDSITLDQTSINLKNNEYYTLLPTLTPSNATTTYKWTSSDTNIATVSSTGKVTGKNTGTATITVTTDNGKTATCTVNVVAQPTGISFVERSYYLREGETGNLTIKLSPTSAVTTYTWTSSDTEVATVDENGVITAIKEGKTTITVKTDNNKTASLKITVYTMPTAVKLAQSFMSMAVGQDFTFTPISEPENTMATYTWKSSNTEIAEIDEDGKVVAKALGTATITVTDDIGHTDTCKITVYPAPEAVKLNAKSVVTTPKNGYQLKTTITPSNAYTSYTWESSDPEVATVDDNGKVKTLSEGTATITVKTSNNITASCTFTVTNSPISTSLDNTDVTMD